MNILSIKNKIDKYKIFKLIFVFLCFMFIDYIELIPIRLFNINDLNGSTLVILNTFKDLVLMLILFIIYRKDLINEWDKFRANIADNIDIGIKYWFLGLIGMVVSNLLISLFFKSSGAANENLAQQYISYLPWLMLFDAGLIAPFNEEIVFRKAFKDSIKNKWAFILLSSFIFGGLHVIASINAWWDILYIFPYSFLGISFALSYYETDTIFTSMTLHIIHNTILIITSIMTLMFIL